MRKQNMSNTLARERGDKGGRSVGLLGNEDAALEGHSKQVKTDKKQGRDSNRKTKPGSVQPRHLY